MRNKNLTYEDVMRIVELVKTTQFREFRLKVGEIEVHLRRSNSASGPAVEDMPVGAATPLEPSPARGRSASFPESWSLVRSPMVGTFYRAPAPGEAPYVEPGQHVEPDTVVGIVEVMKLMNSITAEVRGVVTQVIAENGKSVEHGEVLLAIRPDPEDG